MAAPMQQSQPSQPLPPQGQAQATQAQKEIDVDPIVKVKQFLLPRLKESIVALMKIAGQIVQQNSLSEEGHKTQEGLQQMYERSMEDFYTICDQLEIHLRLALEMQTQQLDSSKFTPLSVSIPKIDNPGMAEQQSVPYPQFLATVKQQISCAKDMYDLLSDFTKKLSDRGRTPDF